MIFLLELYVQPTKIKPKGGKHALVFIGFCGEWSCMLINAWIFEIYFGSLGHSIYYLMHLFLMHQLIGQELVKKTQPNHEMSYCLHCNASETMLFHFRSSCGCMEHWCIKKISKPHKWINLSQAKCAKLVHRFRCKSFSIILLLNKGIWVEHLHQFLIGWLVRIIMGVCYSMLQYITCAMLQYIVLYGII